MTSLWCAANACLRCRPLLSLIKGSDVNVQIKASVAIEVLADHNDACQAAFLARGAGKELIRLLKVLATQPAQIWPARNRGKIHSFTSWLCRPMLYTVDLPLSARSHHVTSVWLLPIVSQLLEPPACTVLQARQRYTCSSTCSRVLAYVSLIALR